MAVAQWQPAYPRLAGALAEEYRALPAAEVARIVGEALPGMDLESAEGFFDDVGRALSGAARAAAPYVAPVVSGAASGAATGAVAGPWGALIGAGLGALTSGIAAGTARGRGPGPRPPSGAAGPVRPATGAAPGPAFGAAPFAGALGGVLGGALGAGRPPSGAGTAVPQLLSALGSPSVQQALLAMLLGRAGARSVPTADGGTVPVAAITNMLAALATRASEEWESVAPQVTSAAWGEGVDEGSAFDRGEWLYDQLLPVELEAQPGEAEAEAEDAAWLDEAYDDFEAFLESWDEDDGAEDVPLEGGESWDEDVDEVRSW